MYETQRVKAADARKARVRQALLTGPILRTLLKLGWPTIVVLVVQTLVGVAETYWVSFLGTAALAGVTLVAPACAAKLKLVGVTLSTGAGGLTVKME